MSLHYTFKWPAGPQEVILTGTFDDWSKSLPLVKQTDGSFSLEVPLPGETDDIIYKYVVDGEWKVNPHEATTKDEAGNENNVIEKEQLHELTTIPGSFIPESGLAAASVPAATSVKEDELKTTVLPKEEPHHQSIAGEPGVFIPKDKETLSAFEKVEDVDAKALNENVTEIGTANINNNTNGHTTITAPTTGVLVEGSELTPEERKKQKKKIKRSQYKAKKKKRAAEANGVNGDAAAGSSELDSEELTPEPANNNEVDGSNEKSKISSTGFAVGAGAGASAAAAAAASALSHHPETLGSSTNAVDNVTKDTVEEPVVDGSKVATSTVEEPVIANSIPVVEEPKVVDSIPAVEEPKVVDSIPVVDETEAEVIADQSAPVVEETKVETTEAPAVDASAISASAVADPEIEADGDEQPKTLDPKVALDNEAKEVDASPVHKEPLVVSQDDEEIIIAAAGDEKDIAAAVGGDVTLEEIQPTESQKERLTKEGKLNTTADVAAAAPSSTTKTAQAPVKKADAPTKATPAAAKASAKTEEKKKGGFRKFIKKIFA